MAGDEQAKIEWLKFLGVRGFSIMGEDDAGHLGATVAGANAMGTLVGGLVQGPIGVAGVGGILVGRALVRTEHETPWPDDGSKKYAPPPRRTSINHQVSSDENTKLEAMDPDGLRKQDLAQCDPRDLFTDEYMSGLTTLKLKGVVEEHGKRNPDLAQIMSKLAKGGDKGIPPEERAEVMEALGAIRGVDAAKLSAQYDRYLIIRKQQKAVREEKNKKAQQGIGEDPGVVPDLDESKHPDFMGSKPQLVFGAVVGEAYGIDPVFGALLSPTGGIIGPGNDELSKPTNDKGQVDYDDPLVLHGIVHDAAGYMFNYHDQGPGYDYLGRESGKGHKTSNPYSGQQSGIRYWHEKMDPSLKNAVLLEGVDMAVDALFVVEDAKALGKSALKTAEEMKVKAEKVLESARETVTEALDTTMQFASETAKKAGTALEQAAQEAASAAKAAMARVEETATESLDSAKEAVGSIRDGAAETLNAAWDFVWS